MRVFLLRAVRSTIRADSDPIRQRLFNALRERSRSVRLACAIHDMLGKSKAAAVFVMLYGARSWLFLTASSRQEPDLVSLAVHANARRRIASVSRIYRPGSVEPWRISGSAILSARHLASLLRSFPSVSGLRRLVSLLRRLAHRHGFLVQARVASTVASYSRARQLLEEQRPKGVLVSSDSNPEELGLVGAAHARSLASVFVSHAYTTSVSPPLDFSLAILEGEAALEAYRQKGPIRSEIYFAGLENESRPMDASRIARSEPSIGVFAPKVVNPSTFAKILEDCHQRFRARKVLIRWHPSMLGEITIPEPVDGAMEIIQTDPKATLPEVVAQCDWIVTDAGSNASIEILKRGVPAITVSDIGPLAPAEADIYGFVANRIVYPPLPRIFDLDISDVGSFYGGDWGSRFRVFDAAYLRPAGDVERELAMAIRGVLDRSRQPVREFPG